MIRIVRYGIAFGRTLWFQTRGPTKVRHFLCFWFLKEARSTDVDKEPLLENGRRYRYWRAPSDIPRGDAVDKKSGEAS